MVKNSLSAFAFALIWWLTGMPISMPDSWSFSFRKSGAEDAEPAM
jgi:hypothetical protein